MINQPIDILKASKYYSDFLDSFSVKETLKYDFNCPVISEAIYFHVFKMKLALWRHKVNFERNLNHSSSAIFQDIIAFYLKVCLSSDYKIILEDKKGKIQPDIVIKRNGKRVFIIEVKTNIGWERPDMKSDEPFKIFDKRINQLSIFGVPKEHIIYILQEPTNAGKEFLDLFWDAEKLLRKPRPKIFPLSQIFPLVYDTDPWHSEKWKANKQKPYVDFSKKEIMDMARTRVVTPFEEILKMIKDS